MVSIKKKLKIKETPEHIQLVTKIVGQYVSKSLIII